jgi:hypothetical protein
MKTLVVGASGATGKLLVEQLLIMGQEVNPFCSKIEITCLF